jgi:acyl-CoA synthetase (AMP-forming)/AMP-acid ligase II
VQLRLVRSSSAALAPQVMARLEAVFRAPVIEAYGMTEAAHQMASNPLPPRQRKPGSVGVAAGPEVAIMDPAGRLLAAGETGEVVIRGDNVTSGYLANPQANAAAFSEGWLRTGDQGWMDEDGYLRLTGRLKEIINRGGEKISPREVDEALLDHPAVAQVVTFALPDEKLGEEVAAAIVLRDGAAATEAEIRDFARARLAAFKVPRRVVFVPEIPKGPTGKMQRIGLAEKLRLPGQS